MTNLHRVYKENNPICKTPIDKDLESEILQLIGIKIGYNELAETARLYERIIVDMSHNHFIGTQPIVLYLVHLAIKRPYTLTTSEIDWSILQIVFHSYLIACSKQTHTLKTIIN